jgi:hypothetical protein
MQRPGLNRDRCLRRDDDAAGEHRDARRARHDPGDVLLHGGRPTTRLLNVQSAS